MELASIQKDAIGLLECKWNLALIESHIQKNILHPLDAMDLVTYLRSTTMERKGVSKK
jgi:hypothetical protein